MGHVPATVIVGAQWGDEGKGKIVDLLAQESDLVCRYQGGPNAGHTIVVADETYKIRQIPTGIVAGKPSAIGAGCVVDPAVLVSELDELEERGVIERKRDPADRRRHRVKVTPAGKKTLAKLRALHAQIDDEFLAPLSTDERATLHSLLHKLAAHHDPRYANGHQSL